MNSLIPTPLPISFGALQANLMTFNIEIRGGKRRLRTGPPFVTAHSFSTSRVWVPFLETSDNFPGPISGAHYSPIAIQFLLILKAKF